MQGLKSSKFRRFKICDVRSRFTQTSSKKKHQSLNPCDLIEVPMKSSCLGDLPAVFSCEEPALSRQLRQVFTKNGHIAMKRPVPSGLSAGFETRRSDGDLIPQRASEKRHEGRCKKTSKTGTRPCQVPLKSPICLCLLCLFLPETVPQEVSSKYGNERLDRRPKGEA